MQKKHLLLSALLGVMICGFTISAQEVVKRKRTKIKLETRELETDNYLIKYEKGIPSATAKRIGKELEDVLEQYVRVFRVKPEKKFKVMFLETRNTYKQMGGPPSSAGFYSPASIGSDGSEVLDRHLYLLQLPFYQLISTTYHEAFHQYLDMYLGYEVSIPIWFNEGMAEYWGEMERGQGFKAKLDPKYIDRRKLRMAKSAVSTRTHIPFAKLIEASREQFYDKAEKGKMALYYSQSFSVICYLMDSTKGKALTFAEALRGTKDTEGHEAAYEKLFGKKRKNLKRAESGWKKYLARTKIRDSSEVAASDGKWRNILKTGLKSDYSQKRQGALKQVDTNTVEGLEALWKVLDSRQKDPLRVDWFVREGVQMALLDAKSDEARAEISRLMRSSGHPRAKEAVVYSVILKIRSDFVGDYGGSDDDMVEEAKRLIRKTRGLELFALLLPRLEKIDPRGEKYQWLKLAFKDQDSRVRRAALQGFTFYPTASTIPLLLENMETLSKEKSSSKKKKIFGEQLLNRFVLEQLSGQYHGDNLEDWNKWWAVAEKKFSLEKRVEEELNDGEEDDDNTRTVVVQHDDIEVKINMKVAGKRDGYPLLVVPWRSYEPDYFRPYFHGLESYLRVYYLYMPRLGDIKGLKINSNSNIPNYPTEQMASVLAQYMEETGLEKFAVLGHGREASTLAMFLAAKRPKMISHLILINPSTSGKKGREAFKRVQGLGRKLANRELIKGIDSITIKRNGDPVYEATDDAEKGGFNRSLSNVRFADPTAPEIGALDYLYELPGGTTAMIDVEWSIQKIFGKAKPSIPALVCIGEKDAWSQVADMQSVAKFLRAIPVKFSSSGVMPFLAQPYEFTRATEKFFKKYRPAKKKSRKKKKK